MEWRDEGLIIGVRRHGEASTIVEAMTRAHGRHLGLVRGGRSARLRATLQPGNTIGLVWRARLDEHLGSFAVEPLALRAGRLMGSALALAGVNYLAALMRVLPERDPHEAVYQAASLIADALDDGALAPTLIARFEAQILAECGFQLDLSRCAATGVTDDLVYVSPKSGRAVSAAAGAPLAGAALAAAPVPAGGRAARSAAERGGDRGRISPDRLLSRPRPVRASRRAPAGLPRRFSQGRDAARLRLPRRGRRRVFAFDRLAHRAPARRRISSRPTLDLFELSRQVFILDRFPNPARIVVRLKMMAPRFIVHAVGHLHEEGQVLRPEVQGVRGAAEIEALVLAKRALDIFPDMALGLLNRRVRLHDLRAVSSASPPEERLALGQRRLRQFGRGN